MGTIVDVSLPFRLPTKWNELMSTKEEMDTDLIIEKWGFFIIVKELFPFYMDIKLIKYILIWVKFNNIEFIWLI